MKYYIYVSDSKVDMLYPQIPKSVRERIAAELKIDLKLVSASFKEKVADETRYSKLKLVADYIEKNLDVGTVDNPKAYFKGTLPMRWGPFGWATKEQVVYFGGSTDRTTLGLGGSIKHVSGSKGDSFAHSHSATPHLLYVLSKELQLPMPSDEPPEPRTGTQMDKMALMAVLLATTQMKGPTQRLEFLAKKLLGGQGPQRSHRVILLGTPIYVALAD